MILKRALLKWAFSMIGVVIGAVSLWAVVQIADTQGYAIVIRPELVYFLFFVVAGLAFYRVMRLR